MFRIRGNIWVWCAVFGASIAPLVGIGVAIATGNLGADPAKTLTRESGIWAFNFLILCLCMSPLARFCQFPQLVAYRRQLGLWCYTYACVHLSVFYIFLLNLDLGRLGKELVERPYITVGFAAWLVFTVMAVTSVPKIVRALGGRRWRRLHKIIFLAATLVTIHFLWLARSDLEQPLLYGAAVVSLIVARLYYARAQVLSLWGKLWRRKAVEA